MSKFIGVLTVATVVMRDNGKSPSGCQIRESCVTPVVFTESVKNLNNTSSLALPSPVRSMNAVFVGRP